MSEALFSEATAVRASAAGSVQWRTQTIQLVNWGGFHGYKEIDISADGTLISGASGTGKSTVLDAYLALMMQSDTPFNAASNDAVVGRARSQDQRTVITYLRGKTDTEREAGTGLLKDKELRPGLTWGAIAVTFVDDTGRQFTALRTYYVPKTATRFADIGKKIATFDGYLNLRDLAQIVDSRFEARELRKQFPNITIHDTYEKFSYTLFTRLGIGANGRGEMALRLLARIQGGQPVKTVDGLYKQMVLEKPSTYEKADSALRHFKRLNDSYESMRTEAAKREVLIELPKLRAEIDEAQETLERIDTFKHDQHPTVDTPFKLWRLRTEFDLLDTTEDTLRVERITVTETTETEARREADARAALAANRAEQEANGGGTLERLERELKDLRSNRSDVERARARYAAQTTLFGDPPDDRDEFATAQETARTFTAVFAEGLKSLDDQIHAIGQQQWPLGEQIKNLKAELGSLQGRDGLVPEGLDTSRNMVAAHLGLNRDDLPFVAELIDVASEHNRWRKAIEVTLFGAARTMLVDERDLSRLSREIDSLRLPVRIQFEGVALAEHEDVPLDPARVSGKLVFKPSPYSNWIRNRVRADNTDALCVDDPRELDGRGPRVTVNGQSRNGKRGAHGEIKGKPIIGFSNEERKVELADEIREVEASYDGLGDQSSAKIQSRDKLMRANAAHTYVLNTEWNTIDLPGVDASIAQHTQDLARIVEGNAPLKALKEAEKRLDEEAEHAAGKKHRAKTRLDEIATEYAWVCDEKDTVSRAVEQIESEQRVILSAEQATYLNEQLAIVVGDQPSTPNRFQAFARQVAERLTNRSSGSRRDLERATSAMTNVFNSYQGQWRDDTLGRGIDAYDRYMEILTNIEDGSLHDKHEEWRKEVAAWSSHDLVQLNKSFGIAIEEINDRLGPINRILEGLPFGTRNYRLQINLRHRANTELRHFRRTLKELSSETVSLVTSNEIEKRFKDLLAFMDTFAEGAHSRDLYLDVRRHIDITATAHDTDGVERATYDSLGGKSGGETQELVAFIVGAALRFQLGDEDRDRPRFAPVFLDEGFVKSDSEHAGRAVRAWQRLGFQLIVGAPEDKVNALEPEMDRLLVITKTTEGRSRVSEIQRGARRA